MMMKGGPLEPGPILIIGSKQSYIGKGATDDCLFRKNKKGWNVELIWLATSIAKER